MRLNSLSIAVGCLLAAGCGASGGPSSFESQAQNLSAPLALPAVPGNGLAVKNVCVSQAANGNCTPGLTMDSIPHAVSALNNISPTSTPPGSVYSWVQSGPVDYTDMTPTTKGLFGVNYNNTNLYPNGIAHLFPWSFAGYIAIPPSNTPTTKTFAVGSDDGALLAINNGSQVLTCTAGIRSFTYGCTTGSPTPPAPPNLPVLQVTFPANAAGALYPIELIYYDNGGVQGLELAWANGAVSTNPTGASLNGFSLIPQANLYAPDIRASMWVDNTTSAAAAVAPGTTLQYTTSISNRGAVGASALKFTVMVQTAQLTGLAAVTGGCNPVVISGGTATLVCPGLTIAAGATTNLAFTATVAAGVAAGSNIDVQGVVQGLATSTDFSTAPAIVGDTSQIFVYTDDAAAVPPLSTQETGNGPAAMIGVGPGLSDDDPTRITVSQPVPQPPAITSPTGSLTSATAQVFAGTSGFAAGLGVRVTVTGPGPTQICNATVQLGGGWTCPALALDAGTWSAVAALVNAAGLTGSPSGPFGLTITPPSAPVVTTPVSNGEITSAPAFVGGTSASPAGSTVRATVLDSLAVPHVCNATVQADQSWICSLTLPDGGYSVTAAVLSITGTPGTASTAVNFAINTGGVPAPLVNQTTALSQNQRPALTGTSTVLPGYKLKVYDGSTLLCTISPVVSPWSCTPSSNLADGTHVATAVLFDSYGAASPSSNADVFVVDSTKPLQPTLVAIPTPTNNSKPTFSGTGEPGATMVVKDSGGNPLCGSTVQSNGAWSCTPAVALSGGYVGVTAVQTDPAGNTSVPSAAIAFTVDTTPPVKPGFNVIPGQPLATNLPLLSGTGAEVGATLTVRDQTGRVLCSFVVTVANWSCTPTVPLADGTSTLTATVVDPAGNATASDPRTVAVDTVAPAAPALAQSSSPTANLRPTFSGTAEAGAKVTVSEGGTLLCSTTANASTGAWSCASTVDLTGGPQTHVVTAVAVDSAGNTSATSNADTFVTDTRAPGAPGLSPVAGSSGAQPGFTSNPQPTFSGSGVAGDLVTVHTPGGAVLCSAVVSATGSWACTTTAGAALSGSPATAYTVVADQTSPSGVTSPLSSPQSFTVLTAAPVKPSIDPLPASSANATPTLSGAAGTGETVVVRDESGRVICSATADAVTGHWTCAAAPLHEGSSTLTATATGKSGLASPPSDPVTTSVDTLAPLPPALAQTPSPTANTLPVFTGTAEPLSQVTIFADGGATPVATCAAGATGQFSCAATTALTGAPGSHTCRAVATDAAGNASGTSNADAFVVDTSTPTAPVLDPQPTPAGGQPGTTGNLQPVFTGTGTAGDTVTVSASSPSAQTLCTALVRADGSWSCQSSLVLTGQPATAYTLSAVQTTPAGVTSPVGVPQTLTVDTSVPLAPTLAGPTTPSNTATVPLSGTGTPGTRVEVRDATGAVVCAVAVVPAGGDWTCQAGPLADGTSQLTAVTVGAGGVVSGTSSAIAVTVDTVAPVAPQLAQSPSPSSQTLPVFTGTAEPGASVQIFDGSGTTPVATCTADLRGVFRCPATVPLTGGPSTHDVHAVATDAAGNASSASNTDSFVVDTRLPIAPTLDPLATPAGGLPGFTANPQPGFSGTGAAGDTVVVSGNQGAGVLCTAVVRADGTWSCQSAVVLTGAPATTYGVSVTETSPAGVTSGSSATETITVVTAAPATPTLVVPASPSGTGTPTLSGTGTVGTTVVVHDGTGATVCTATVQADGTWSCTATSRLPDGSGTLTATAVGPSGVTSPPTSPAPLTVDTQPPDAPGLVQTPSLLGITHPTFSGSAEPGSNVTVREGGQVLCTAVADAAGAFHCTSAVALTGTPQLHTVTATATDVAGNTSAPSVPDAFVVDTTVPPAPGIDLAPAPPGGQPGTTTAANPVITGTGSPGATVTVAAGGTTLCTALVLADGTWRCTSTTPLPGDPPTATTLSATQTTPAGIAGPAGTQTLTVDTSTPAAPTLDAPATPGADPQPTFTGAGQPGATVSLVDAYGRLVCRGTVGANGRWSCRPAQPMSDGDFLLQALQTSPGGLQSGKSGTQPLSLRTLVAPTLAQPASPTRSAQPPLSGTGTPGRTVLVYSGPTLLCSAVVAAVGSWSCTPSAALPSGSYLLSAVQTDGAGHDSTPTDLRALLIDHDAPAAPGLDVPATTEETQPLLSGTAEAGSTVTVRDGSGNTVCTAVVSAAGTWSCTPLQPLPLGPTGLSADATDAAGNVSARATDTVVVIAHVVPPGQLIARGGCASGGVPAPALALLALLWFARRRKLQPRLARAASARQGRALRLALPLLFVSALSAGAARAQTSTDLELFHPASGGDGFVGVEGARPLTSGDGKVEVKLWGGTSFDPLVTRDPQGNRQVLVSNRLAGWLDAQVHVWDNLSIAAQLPIVLAQSGNLGSLTPSAPGALSLGGGVGDLRVTPRWALLRQVEVGLDLAMQLSVDLPTGKAGSMSGTGRFGGEGLLALGRRFYTPGAAFFELLGNGYVRLRPPAQILDVKIGNELGLRAALGYYPNVESKALPQRFFLEGEGRSWMRGGFANGTAPAEWRAGATWCFGKGLALDAAGGTALGSGVGSPKARFLLGFGYSPEACRPSDRDGDGIADRLDKCPNQPGPASNGGCPAPPDADGDGVPDSEDACPMVAGLKENRGCPANWDRDGDGVPDLVDRCPEVPGPASNNGCPLPPAAVSCVVPPEKKMDDLPLVVDSAPPPLVMSIAAPLPDRDGDGVPDAEDNCPDQPGPKENQGCPKTVKQLVVIKGDKIDILDKVYFASAKAVIEKRSYGLLDQVASVLKSHPELVRIEIQGHTDNGGDAKKNEKLSQSRAEAVVVYLIRGGVGIARMSAKGYGASQPAVPNTSKANKEKNRRVEFHVLEIQNKTVEVQVPAKS